MATKDKDEAVDELDISPEEVQVEHAEKGVALRNVQEGEPSPGLFGFMASHPVPFLFIIPIILIVLTALGWSREDKIEDQVSNIWIPERSAFSMDKEYIRSVEGDETGPSTIVAMAVSREEEGGNLFTAESLDEIADRMMEVDQIAVTYKGNTFTMKDVCARSDAGQSGTTYEYPCVRLTPMDLFEETRWSFDESDRLTWYNDLIHPILARPRIARFGILKNFCTSGGANANDLPDILKSFKGSCDHDLLLRTNGTYALENGKPADYANPTSLLSDIGDFENNYPCKICVDNMYDGLMAKMTKGTVGMFQLLMFELNKIASDPAHANEQDAQMMLPQVQKAFAMVKQASVEEFWTYFVTRSLYAELGAVDYMNGYALLMASLLPACLAIFGGDASQCPPATVTLQEARDALLRHADHSFSAVNTGGSPFPLWLEDATGMFFGSEPVGGSGIDMNGFVHPLFGRLNSPLMSSRYFDLEKAGTAEWAPLYGAPNSTFNPFDLTQDPSWPLVQFDPIYVWFMASVTEVSASCNNGKVGGTITGNTELDQKTGAVAATRMSPEWCTQYNEPTGTDEIRTQTHFAKMWYDLLIDSEPFLGINQGEDDPYSFTTGQGCDYELTGSRYSYTGQSTDDILYSASRDLYYIDEGVSIGALDTSLLIGDVEPPNGEYNFDNPLKRVGAIQNLYFLNIPSKIVDRVKNCNRPGGPIEDLTEEDAKEILRQFKLKFEDDWSRDWDDEDSGNVQFVAFADDTGAEGTTQRVLNEVTLSSGQLMGISIFIIFFFSVVFLFSFDVIQSKVLVTIVGVSLVIIAFFGALGTAILSGIKLNVGISWTLPFIIIGLGVDDMYIVLLALKGNRSYTRSDFIATMKHVVVPVSMTSMVNFCMFSVMNISDIPGVYTIARTAMIAVAFLWATIILCFPAYCYLDTKRQEAGRVDVLFCIKKRQDVADASKNDAPTNESLPTDSDPVTGFLYDKFYKPLIIREGLPRTVTHVLVGIATLTLLGVSIWGATQGEVGLGLEDFFPYNYQAGQWARYRTEYLASWPMTMNWGAVNYTNPDTQMRMIWQFENVVSTEHIAEVDTNQLWIADFAVWTTRQCTDNFYKRDPAQPECGSDIIYPGDGTMCEGTWMPNTLGLREKVFNTESCQPREGGVCRPTNQMHPFDLMILGQTVEGAGEVLSWCPVFQGWSDDKLKFCVEKWRDFTGGGGGLILEDDTANENPKCKGEFLKDDEIISPIPLSKGPSMFAIKLFSHQDTVDMIEQTRAFCDDDEQVHCVLSGIPYDYWEQYTTIYGTLYETSGVAIAIGFVVAVLFLFVKIYLEPLHNHSVHQILAGSLAGGFIIAITCLISVITVIGLSSLAEVNLTAFSVMSYVLSIGFAVEYSVHVTHRWLTAPSELESAKDRVGYSMSFLFLPTFMSFISSTIGVVCLAFTDFEFNRVFFFRPLLIVMFVTYFYGCYSLPVLLSTLNARFLRLGQQSRVGVSDSDGKGDHELGEE
uniref:SSD domain-containing protein n=1 Tax=Ditylum brightwellii TaxID=49249 RepID=A0A6V2M2U5_9STRA